MNHWKCFLHFSKRSHQPKSCIDACLIAKFPYHKGTIECDLTARSITIRCFCARAALFQKLCAARSASKRKSIDVGAWRTQEEPWARCPDMQCWQRYTELQNLLQRDIQNYRKTRIPSEKVAKMKYASVKRIIPTQALSCQGSAEKN